MKKILAVLISVLLLFCLTACGEDEVKDTDTQQTTAEETTAEEITKPEVFEQVTIADNEHFSFTVLDVYEDEVEGYVMKADIRNKSADADYSLTLDACSINGIAVSSTFYSSDIKAGKKSVEEINCYDELLKNNSVGEYTDIEMVFSVYTDLLADEALAEYVLHYYPSGQENATKYERTIKDTDKVLVDNEYMTIVATMISHDEEWECQKVNLYLVNKTNEDVSLDGVSFSINDVMIESFYLEMIPEGKCCYSSIEFDDRELEDKGIEAIENIEIEFEAYGEYDYEDVLGDVEDLLNGDFTIDDILNGTEDAMLFSETVVYKP